MREPKWTAPSVVPDRDDRTFYFVLDDFGHLGECWRETDVKDTELEAVITDLLEGQYINPVRVVSFNIAEGWCRDVSQDVAGELARRCGQKGEEMPASLQAFFERHQVAADQRQLRLV